MSYQKHFPVPPNTDEKHTNYVNGSTVLTADHMGTIRDAIQADEDYLVAIDGQIEGAIEDIADLKEFDQSMTQEMNMMQDDIDNRVSVLPEQGLTDEQKATARSNIDAAAVDDSQAVSGITTTITAAPGVRYKCTES